MQWLTKKEDQKAGNLIPSQYVTQLGILGASPHHERQTQKHSSILLDGNLTQNQQRVS